MSLETLTNYMAAQGRNGDSAVVHMHPDEVSALNELSVRTHGIPLSRNPVTGAAEAFSLKEALPAIIGVGGAFMGLPTWAIALANAGATTATTGSLEKGLLSGALSYGLGSLAGGAGDAAAAGGDAAAGAGAAGAAGAADAAGAGAANAAGQGLTAPAAGEGLALTGAGQGAAQGLTATPSDAALLGAGGAGPGAPGLGDAVGQGLSPSATAAAGLGTGPSTAAAPNIMDSAANWVKENPMKAGIGALTLASATESPPDYGPTYKGSGLLDTETTASRDYLAPGESYRPGRDGGHSYFAPIKFNKDFTIGAKPKEEETEAGFASGGDVYVDRPPTSQFMPSQYAMGSQVPGGSSPIRMAEGGLPSISRYIQGPGDGMSDDIPAVIDGQQPAALGTSEFVLPADVVSHIGNGSSEAGAKRLMSMMDQIRKARTGTKKQGKQINPDRYLPA